MPEPVTYYSRDSKDYAVFVCTIEEVWAIAGYIPRWDRIRDNFDDAMRHLEIRAKARREGKEGDDDAD